MILKNEETAVGVCELVVDAIDAPVQNTQNSTSNDPEASRMREEELQRTMVIWHEVDGENAGLDVIGLSTLVKKLATAFRDAFFFTLLLITYEYLLII